MAMAERFTGLHDFGPPDFRDRLDETIASLAQTDWNAMGRFGLRYILHWHLANRLRIVELLKQRPDIKGINIERPVIITGLFRTGTTFLHNVLAADPSNRVTKLWEAARPVGRKRDFLGDEKWRRWRTGHEVKMDEVMIPEQAVAHQVLTEANEEDFFLLENDMAIMKFCVGMGDFGYGMKMLEWDMVGPYKWHKLQLKILWEQRSASRWLLKCPWHLWNLEALLAVYPDARIIHTHRKLVPTIGSQCSLSARISAKFRRDFDLDAVGEFWLEYSRLGIERGQQAKDALPESQVYDVRLDDLRTRPIEVIEDIYKRFDLPFDKTLAALLAERASTVPKLQYGEHEYDIADYGLNEQQIRAHLSEYRERFNL